MSTVFVEYSNQHDHRKYPFLDDSSMTSKDGVVLPTGYIRDLFYHPITSIGATYLKTLSPVDNYLELADVSTGNVVGRASWVQGDTDAPIYETGIYGRQLGIVVFGDTATQALPSLLLEFPAEATTVVSTCAIPLIQAGVRGLLCDGHVLTGDITIIGKNGVVVTTELIAGNKNVLRIDVTGEPPAPIADCDGSDGTIVSSPVITTIHIINEVCAAMIGSGDANGNIFLMGRPGWSAADNCPAQVLPSADGVLPTAQDEGCNPPAPPVPPDCGGATEYVIPVVKGTLQLLAPSTLAADNPFKVSTEDTPGESLDLVPFNDITSVTDLERRRQNMFANMGPAGVIVLKVRGRLQ